MPCATQFGPAVGRVTVTDMLERPKENLTVEDGHVVSCVLRLSAMSGGAKETIHPACSASMALASLQRHRCRPRGARLATCHGRIDCALRRRTSGGKDVLLFMEVWPCPSNAHCLARCGWCSGRWRSRRCLWSLSGQRRATRRRPSFDGIVRKRSAWWAKEATPTTPHARTKIA